VEYPGAVYHVIVRGNERRAVFRDDADRKLYLERLEHYEKRLGFRVYAYCLMTNHIQYEMSSDSRNAWINHGN
jgi:putative transposase